MSVSTERVAQIRAAHELYRANPDDVRREGFRAVEDLLGIISAERLLVVDLERDLIGEVKSRDDSWAECERLTATLAAARAEIVTLRAQCAAMMSGDGGREAFPAPRPGYSELIDGVPVYDFVPAPECPACKYRREEAARFQE